MLIKASAVQTNTLEIAKTIIDRGYLSKAEIQHLWGLTDEDYAEIQLKLSTIKVLQPGPRGRGGFKAHYAKRPKQPDETAAAPAFEHA